MSKVRRIICVLIIMLILAAFLSGCDSKDINKKAILTAVALDKIGDEIIFYAEIANIEGGGGTSENKGGTGSKYMLVAGRGKTISEARDDLDRQLDKEVYLSTVRALILTENFAKEHLVEYLYRLRAYESYRKKTITVITQQDPELLFKSSHENDQSLGFYIEDTLMSLEENGETFTRTTTRILENLSDKYTGILLHCIGLKDGDISLVGYSVVFDTTIVGLIPVDGAKSLIFFKADKPKFDYAVPYQDKKLTIEVELKKKKIQPTYENEIIHYDMTFNFEAKLMYGDKKTPYGFTETDNAEISSILTDMIKTELIATVDQAQKNYKCDYLQFDDEFRIKFPSQFEKMDWGTEFQKATFNIDVKVELSSTWMMDYETSEQK